MSKENVQTANTPPVQPPMRPGGFGGAQRRGLVVKPKNFKGTLKRLWEYFGRERKMLSVIFIFIVIDSALMLLAPFLIGKAIDAMDGNGGTIDFNFLEVM